ncbi:MAG TPA: diphosphomevalonate decarboxylase [Bdellovibrionales bacterium]|nr:diphosphomevalonate decarboxylase [Bdellovibrionales bacterium]
MRAEASAPSNIALIKYMGKSSTAGNLPTNSSLSYAPEYLRTFVTIEKIDATADYWEPLPGLPAITLGTVGLDKFLRHFGRLKDKWGVPGNYVLRSANNFPSDCGLASSASSFAALTLATARLAESHHGTISADELSRESRQGSGSSCRSFFTPWALWRHEGAEPVNLKLRLEHAVLLIEDGKKPVSTSDAHQRVASSLNFIGRADRANHRLNGLLYALEKPDWQEAFELCWAEFWDMHALFETANPSFTYMKPETFAALEKLRGIWRSEGDGPLVTMDAGANIHLFLRADQVDKGREWVKGYRHLSSWMDR